jgi:single-stranded DNA-binding protein
MKKAYDQQFSLTKLSFLIVNKIQLIGRVGTTPVSTEFSENRRVYNYTLATSETRPDKEGMKTLYQKRFEKIMEYS